MIDTNACRASVVLGNVPRLVTVSVSRRTDTGWQAQVDGTKPPLTITAGTDQQLGLSLVAGGDGVVQVKLGSDRTYTTRVDSSSPPPTPPYSLSFHAAGAEPGCALVWLEIPFPFPPKGP